MRTILVMGALALGGCGASGGGWRIAERVAIGTATGGLACDWHGTRSVAQRGWVDEQGRGQHESNPIMGAKPDASTVDLYFLGVFAASALAYVALPRRYRILVPLLVTAIETKAVVNNVVYRVGVCGLGSS